MSKPSLSSLFSLITAQQAQIAALTARLDAPAPAPASPQKQKQKRAKKDPNAPKRAPTTFFLFSATERAKSLAAGGPKLDAKVCAERWRALTDDERASFKPAAAPALPAAKPTFQEVRDVAATMSSTVAAKFMRFCTQNPTLDAKTAEAHWKALSPEKKAEFNDAGDDTDEDDDSSDDEDDVE
jgi:high mobility group protein B1